MAEEFNIDALAALSRIRLEPAEKAKLAKDLEKILGYVKELAALDTKNVEPTTHALPLENVFRPDEVKPSKVRDQVLDHAPKREGSFFKVPKVIEREE
ncbi:MAG: Asp-tRNA(Asn)/Glu-tRNA(Gln) amidotransferase subunit GatC [Candidatus Omnitrophica bacterium]|nr:Asp-tRNA(Asn)/Glu-tRNA(Gln) amidotransferase subunit GatC [Candidatus Omnitrophota bacterium]